jgi:hypothetical protein
MIKKVVLSESVPSVSFANGERRQIFYYEFDDNYGVWSGYAPNSKYDPDRPVSDANAQYALVDEEVPMATVARHGLRQKVITESEYYAIVAGVRDDMELLANYYIEEQAHGEFILQEGKEVDDDDLLSLIVAVMSNDWDIAALKVSAHVERRPHDTSLGMRIESFVVVEASKDWWGCDDEFWQAQFIGLVNYLWCETESQGSYVIKFWRSSDQKRVDLISSVKEME